MLHPYHSKLVAIKVKYFHLFCISCTLLIMCYNVDFFTSHMYTPVLHVKLDCTASLQSRYHFCILKLLYSRYGYQAVFLFIADTSKGSVCKFKHSFIVNELSKSLTFLLSLSYKVICHHACHIQKYKRYYYHLIVNVDVRGSLNFKGLKQLSCVVKVPSSLIFF